MSARRCQRGLTLIELMLSLALAGVLLAFILTLYTRISVSYRAQTRLSELNQTLRAARALLAADLRLAGYLVPDGGVSVAAGVPGAPSLLPIEIRNDPDGLGPDAFTVTFGDPSLAVPGILPSQMQSGVPDEGLFAIGDLVMLAGRDGACLVKVTQVNPMLLLFTAAGAPYNSATNPHCTVAVSSPPVVVTRFRRRSYRIDPTRPALGVLQMSPSGGAVAGDWIDLGIGFTNLQLASRYRDPLSAIDLDGDGDPVLDWYSSGNQSPPPPGAQLVQVSLGIEMRSRDQLDVVESSATPAFGDPANLDHNPVGDWAGACPGNPVDPCGIDLLATPDASRPDRYRGRHVYRSSTSLIDLRNVGRRSP